METTGGYRDTYISHAGVQCNTIRVPHNKNRKYSWKILVIFNTKSESVMDLERNIAVPYTFLQNVEYN